MYVCTRFFFREVNLCLSGATQVEATYVQLESACSLEAPSLSCAYKVYTSKHRATKRKDKKIRKKKCQCRDSKLVPKFGGQPKKIPRPPSRHKICTQWLFFLVTCCCAAYNSLVLLCSYVHHVAVFGRTEYSSVDACVCDKEKRESPHTKNWVGFSCRRLFWFGFATPENRAVVVARATDVS